MLDLYLIHPPPSPSHTHTPTHSHTHTQDETCHFKSANVGATCSSYVDIPSGSESDLQVASATVGPISVAIDASHLSFQVRGPRRSVVRGGEVLSGSEKDNRGIGMGRGLSEP